MAILICSLSSSSKGNSTFIRAGKTNLIIDAGLTGKRMEELLSRLAVLPESLAGILVTHEHSDHVKGVGVLSRRYNVPVYVNEPTYYAMKKITGDIPERLLRIIQSNADFFIDDVQIEPIPIPHDAAEPVAYRIYHRGRSVSVLTDVGHLNAKLFNRFKQSDFILLESNHDEEMLKNNDKYPVSVKRRILGNHGHLSNEACALMIYNMIEHGTKHFLLGHLSPENNNIELAINHIGEKLLQKGLKESRDYFLFPTYMDKMSESFEID